MNNITEIKAETNKPPCVPECPGRHARCHGSCSAYAEYAARQEKIRDGRLCESEIQKYQEDQNKKYDKYHHRHKGRWKRK